MLAAGATGDFQIPSKMNCLCWPLRKSRPGLASGTFTMVVLIRGLGSPFIFFLLLRSLAPRGRVSVFAEAAFDATVQPPGKGPVVSCQRGSASVGPASSPADRK